MGKFRFKPIYAVSNRKGLMELLKNHNEHQIGGVNVDDLNESMKNPDRAVEKLLKEDKIYVINTREQSKKRILYYKDKKYTLNFDADLKRRWRNASIEDDAAIQRSLAQHNLTGMVNKSRAATNIKRKGGKKSDAPKKKRR